MSEQRDTAKLVGDSPSAKRSLSYTETEDHQFSGEQGSHTLYRAGLSSGCCHFEDTHALRMIVAWMATVAVVVFVALVVEIITQVQVVHTGDVVTDHPNCSLLALAALREGGNAVDAAVVAGLCLAIAVPDRAGLGGGGVMLIHQLRTNTSTVIDFQDVSPSGLHIQDYQSNFQISGSGWDSVAVPGLVAGLHHAHTKYGSHAVKLTCCSWNDLVRKVFQLLNTGFTPEQWWTEFGSEEEISPELQKFITDGGYSRPDSETAGKMKETFNSLLNHNPVHSFYKGSLASKLSSDTQGHISKADMANYTVVERPALRASLGEYDVITAPTPTSGPEMIAVLNAIQRIIGNNSIEAFDTDNYVEKIKNVLENVHRQQRLLGDPAADQVHQNDANYKTTADRMENLISKENVGKWMSQRSGRQLQSAGRAERLPGGTVVSVMDHRDVYVSMVLSLNSPFGSRMFSNGFLLNNALNAFQPPVPGEVTSSNELYEGLRSLSRAAPVVAVNTAGACRTRLVTGGGLAEQVAQVLGPVIIGDYIGDYKRILDESRLLVLDDTVWVQEKQSHDFLSRQDIPKKSAINWSKINLLEKNQDAVSGHSEAGGDSWATLRS